jgi:hypothetical protein
MALNQSVSRPTSPHEFVDVDTAGDIVLAVSSSRFSDVQTVHAPAVLGLLEECAAASELGWCYRWFRTIGHLRSRRNVNQFYRR